MIGLQILRKCHYCHRKDDQRDQIGRFFAVWAPFCNFGPLLSSVGRNNPVALRISAFFEIFSSIDLVAALMLPKECNEDILKGLRHPQVLVINDDDERGELWT